MKLNFIQDIASPHNNVIAKALNDDKSISLNLWYCHKQVAKYGWKEDLTNQVKEAKMYSPKWPDFSFLKYCLTHKEEKFLIVGWQNLNTRLLMLLFFIFRRPYSVWFDLPDDNKKRTLFQKMVRGFFYFILKHSKAHVFGVGKMTVDYFKKRGFVKERLTNLPIFVDITETAEHYQEERGNVYQNYGVKEEDFLISAGSRLVYDKGYDILIEAIYQLPYDIKKNVKCVIVGKGEEKERLAKQIQQYALEDNIILEEWLEFGDFKALIANSHVFVHPARFDAFGGTIFAHTLGTPVIGSLGAGAAYDRIINGENGYLYPNDDPSLLAEHIVACYEAPHKLEEMSKQARETAEAWAPNAGVGIIKSAIL